MIQEREPAATGRRRAPEAVSGRPLRVLFVSRNYPNPVMPLLGLWVEGLAQSLAKRCEVRVISPVPYCPPIPGLSHSYTRYRAIPRRDVRDRIDVLHPRLLLAPGYWYHGLESISYSWAVSGVADRLRREFDFDLIHAEFSFPDGFVAARLGQRYGVPVLITEQAPWHPWMDEYRLARMQALWAVRHSAFHIAISRSLRAEIAHFTGDSRRLRLIPNGVDTDIFRPAPAPAPDLSEILFVGAIRRVKGVDLLLRALRILLDRGRKVKLTIVGEPLFRSYSRDADEVRALARDLMLEPHLEFAGGKAGGDLAKYMRRAGVLVLPSRKESLGMVLAEAISCGTPVVATRCGGPEDIVTDQVGALAPPEDPEALADGIAHVLDHRAQYDPERLHRYIEENFSWESVVRRVMPLYADALSRSVGPEGKR